MQDTAALRATMVATQLRTNDVSDARVCQAMATIPRELFLPAELRPVAYAERCIALGKGRVLLDPRSLGKMLQLAAIRPEDAVLDVGCGPGYSSALLSLLGGRVVALEEDATFAARAEENLKTLGARNVAIVRGPLRAGCPQEAPFDVIFMNGAVEIEPQALLDQLNDGGRLVTVASDGAAGHAMLYVRHDGAIGDRSAFDASVPVLPGFERPRGFIF